MRELIKYINSALTHRTSIGKFEFEVACFQSLSETSSRRHWSPLYEDYPSFPPSYFKLQTMRAVLQLISNELSINKFN